MAGKHILGLDIGGANIKAAHVDGAATSEPFALWQQPERLPEKLQEILSRFPQVDQFAVTMTGELVDCFETKAEGVDHILTAVEQVAEGRSVHIWQTVGEFVTSELAREFPLLVGAANWHALATWVGRSTPHGNSLLIDIGSTTSDIIPLQNGCPLPQGRTDVERLLSGELVYTGVRRTPLIALAKQVPFRGQQVPLAAELFATTYDIYLITESLVENSSCFETANGKPATKAAAYDRLARLLCCDLSEVSVSELDEIADFLCRQQIQKLETALAQVLGRMPSSVQTVVLSGEGALLAERLIADHPELGSAQVIKVNELFSAEVSSAACAYALSQLASEEPTI